MRPKNWVSPHIVALYPFPELQQSTRFHLMPKDQHQILVTEETVTVTVNDPLPIKQLAAIF